MVQAVHVCYVRFCPMGAEDYDFRGVIMEQTFGWKNAVVGVALTIIIVCSACAVAFS